MKTFAISDIHGCCREFTRLLSRMPIYLLQDRLILLGDYIDRGPESYDVIRSIMALQAEYGCDHVVVLRGNHEQMAVDYYRTGDISWNYNGNEATIESFARHQEDVRHYLDFFQSLPLLFQDEDAIYVHAGIDPSVGLAEQRAEDLLFIREEFILSRQVMPKTVIFGHTPTLMLTRKAYPVILPDRIAIDTGCVYGGNLTGVEILAGHVNAVYQVRRMSAEAGN